jgi:hypothetical protein
VLSFSRLRVLLFEFGPCEE